jgi:hypothetical protein
VEAEQRWLDALDAVQRRRPAGFSRLVASFMARAVRRANRKDLAKRKSILESR